MKITTQNLVDIFCIEISFYFWRSSKDWMIIKSAIVQVIVSCLYSARPLPGILDYGFSYQ